MFLKRQDRRISIIGGLILAALTLAAGISVYVVMQRQAESLLSESLQTALQRDLHFIEMQMDQAVSNTQTAATRPVVMQYLQLLASKPGNATGLNELQQITKSLLGTGFTGLSFYDIGAQEVAHAGYFSQKHDLRVLLKTNDRTFLLWDEQFILQISKDVVDQQGRRIGMVMTEAHLPHLTLTFGNTASIGNTGEFAVCARLADDEKNTDCFLSTIAGKEFKRFPRRIEGKSLPMNHALNGEAGTIFTQDYRLEQVIAAYAPVKAFGLGMVLKIDQAELYNPVTKQLKFIALLLVALVLVGVLLLNFLVKPLVSKLVESEEVFRRLFEDANDPNLLIKNGCFVECNAATLQLLGPE